MTTSLGGWPELAPESADARSVVARSAWRDIATFALRIFSGPGGSPQQEHDYDNRSCNEQDFIPTTLMCEHSRIVEASL